MNKRNLLIVAVVLLIPLIPFLIAGPIVEPLIETTVANLIQGGHRWQTAAAILGGLTVDIFLPVPSSVLLTYAGRCFGSVTGAMVGWLGLNLSAAAGFYVSRWIGQPAVERFSSQDAVAKFQLLNEKSGSWALVACRPLPILAEASVIFAGLSDMSGRRFWIPVVISNGVIALLYAVLGDFASRHQWFPVAVLGSMVLPVLFVLFWQRRQKSKRRQTRVRVTVNQSNH